MNAVSQLISRLTHAPQPQTPSALDSESEPRTREGDERCDRVVGDRGIVSVNRARSIQSRLTNILAMGLMAALGLGLLTWYYAQMASRHSRSQQTAQAASKAKAQGEMPLPSLGRIDPPMQTETHNEGPPALDQVLGPRPDPPAMQNYASPKADSVAYPASYGAAPAAKTPAQLALERRLSGPVFATSSEGTARNGAPPSGAAAASAAAGESSRGEYDGLSASTNDNGVAALLKPGVMPAARARVLPTERMLLPKGAFVDCTLETAIDSTLPGMTTCITATDTFGADGSVVLLERGTKLVGETRGEVKQGSARVFVVWTEARTPTGVVVPLDSLGTDELGRSGLQGKVNRHFFERFGAAILISVIDGAIDSATQSRGSGDTVVYSTSTSQDIMTEVLKSTVNIPPTVVKQNGDRIQVLVARDLDFRPVYELRPERTR